MKFSKKLKQTSGFTLIEMMVAVSIFAIVMTISMAALLNIIALNKKSQAVKTIMNNLNFAMEEMSRDIRFGLNYECNSVGYYVLSTPGHNHAGDGCNPPGTPFHYVSFTFEGIRDPNKIVYYYLKSHDVGTDTNCSQIWKYTTKPDGTLIGNNPITAPEVCIQDTHAPTSDDGINGLKFYVLDASVSDLANKQARVLVIVSGYTGSGKSKTMFNLQTTETQRQLNI
ncbi:MAG: type II secretion system protein [Candidatus Pacebacteria bacterium]|nr:type II secretion system protein [Candidatus Paceibacterota bacterium]MDD5357092.1 type II secretion system protein [Candidatus Paceibacterota bacterium]